MARGEKHYSAFCSICHTGPVNPDLRRSAVLGSGEAWKAIVLDGVMESAGMAGFSAYLSAQDAEAIRAFVNQKARALKEIEMQ
jgi:mono/diheme cytochrome c family protein